MEPARRADIRRTPRKDFALRQRATLFLTFLLATVIAAAFGATQFTKAVEAASAVLEQPTADCSGTPDVTFTWLPLPGTIRQHLEMSLSAGFEPETVTTEDLAGNVATHTMPALKNGAAHFWRIVSETDSGDVESEPEAFVPCGAPVLLNSPLQCRTYTTAALRVNWAPVATDDGKQWVEFDSNEDWGGDDFLQAGPYNPALASTRRSNFFNDITYYYRVVSEVNGVRQVSNVGSFTPDCYPTVNPENYGTDDRLVIPAISVEAPVNIRDVGPDGLLGVPSGGYDVVKYNFPFFPQMQGQVGGPGPTMIAGHYDYHVIGPAVFWDLGLLQPGNVIEYWDGDVKYTYVIQWVAAVPYSEPLNSYLESPGDAMILVTCFGTFDRAQYGGYDQRTIVYATPQ
jgi:hypothetical protein